MSEPERPGKRRDITGDFVEFIDIQKTYDGETLVVKNLNLSIRHGEFLTLLGPSGSGKTTSLMMLAGFEVPTQGRIELDGRRINDLAPHKRDIGMVFQNYALFPHMTVEENLAFPLQVRRMPRPDIDKKLERALEMVQLTQMRRRRPSQLSGGQQQRVALARALVFDPKLVLMDEPLGALDKQLREHMQIEIKHIHEQLGVTVVYVTHDQSEALTMSDRVAVFNDGIVQQLAPPADLYERPENAFVAQFIGENNKLTGVVSSLNAGECVVDVNGYGDVRALPIRAHVPGNKTTLSLRPERVRINPTAGACANLFDARVEELIYLGDHTRARVSVLGSSDFIIKLPNAEGVPDLTPGLRIRVGWRPEDCRALDCN
ncbi:spermidine/putrescine ABC transporter ATP-binding protein [Mesorhizobium sp. LSJC255A00]|uniref:ABC transporter ATP-binding protein n=1 Tax=unclassified Mesorhizobium TaxID=325217 RepID=UPI0003CE67CD|nr:MULTISPECIES: ABC transporter ATP-binding protein [unclassified Mesorhizobium]ESX20123.1 spermidine/putrescine ABC transporter ATP-binding protein [Mesorhizobium sp. LSJC255A00]ESX78077.1 spermidine/putrescine ABC transporter ATP-binding protein [Mesorhizobium sp. LSHC414A00]